MALRTLHMTNGRCTSLLCGRFVKLWSTRCSGNGSHQSWLWTTGRPIILTDLAGAPGFWNSETLIDTWHANSRIIGTHVAHTHALRCMVVSKESAFEVVRVLDAIDCSVCVRAIAIYVLCACDCIICSPSCSLTICIVFALMLSAGCVDHSLMFLSGLHGSVAFFDPRCSD